MTWTPEKRELKRRRLTLQLQARKKARGCDICGYNKSGRALHYHHRDPATKRRTVAHMMQYSEAVREAEIAKCDLLCANCHIELEDNDLT